VKFITRRKRQTDSEARTVTSGTWSGLKSGS